MKDDSDLLSDLIYQNSEKVNTYNDYNKDIIMICRHAEVHTFYDNMSGVIDMANEITSQYTAPKDFEKKANESSFST